MEGNGAHKRWNIPRSMVIIFIAAFTVSLLANIKFVFFQEQASYKNIPINGVVEANDTVEIVIKGFDENREGFRERYRISNSDQMKIVDENGQYISFQDLKPDMYVEVRLWHDGFELHDMDVLNMVTRIKCSETKEGLDKK